MRSVVFATACVVISAPAWADTFSAFSDRNRDGPIFASAPMNTREVVTGVRFDLDGVTRFGLHWDEDGDGPGAGVFLPATFRFSGVLGDYTTTTLPGGVLHSYRMNNVQYRFDVEGTTDPLLIVTAPTAFFTSISSTRDTWGQTASITSDENLAPNISFQGFGPLAGRNLFASEDFGFALSNLRNVATGGRVGVESNGNPLSVWAADASWTAHAIPTPGAIALLGLGGLALARRTRR